MSFFSEETFRKVSEIPKVARKKVEQKSQPFGIEQHRSEFPAPFGISDTFRYVYTLLNKCISSVSYYGCLYRSTNDLTRLANRGKF